MQRRRRFKQSSTLEARLEGEAERLRAQAMLLPLGAERESRLRKVREIERTREMIDWINSPALQRSS
jgi:hypothetical protein